MINKKALRAQKLKDKESRKAALLEKQLIRRVTQLLPEVKVSGTGTFTPPKSE